MFDLEELYREEFGAASARADALCAQFFARFHSAPKHFFSSPGRAEIVGNHTDHNLGKVLCASISCDIFAAVSPRENTVEVASEGFRPIRISLKELSPRERERRHSAALVRGVLSYLQTTGRATGGFCAATSSSIFRGAGVSSSAAFAVLVAEIENVLYNGGNIPPMELARAAQYAENVHFGKPCGLLDQTAVALGGLNKIDFKDPLAPLAERLPLPSGYGLVLVNTGGSHANMTAHYAAIKEEMGEVAAYFGKKTLRELTRGQVYEALSSLRKRVSDRAILRAMHFFEENERVDAAASALRTGDMPLFLRQIRESGESSLRYLQNCAVPASRTQPIVLALKLAGEMLEEGACRVMGGGFAGAVLAVLKEGERERYCGGMARVFGEENVFSANIRPVGTCEWKK